MSAERDKFIKDHEKEVVDACCGTGLFPSVKMGQMMIESANSAGQPGQGITALKANNYFGIKASSAWKGQTMTFSTPKDGKPVSTFRVYPTVKDSIIDHTKFLQENSRYKTAGVFDAKTPEDQIRAIAKAGYAEAGKYDVAVIAMINGYNLKRLDTLCTKKK